MIPTPRTRTRRRANIAGARKALAAAGVLMDRDEPTVTEARVRQLLWAQAYIEQSLHLETQGRLGDRYATPARIVGRLKGTN